ncbi:MAG: YceH family protein [Planctomycetes bacterium]|nr:YceH family protein [Planctomycetota bacterium]
MELTFNERRVLGVLLEKGFTTPDQYPLTLNALVTASNQKSCRHPVTQLTEDQVLEALDRLRKKGLCSLVQPAGGRTNRWRHLVRETWQLDGAEGAVLAELLLRGPQTDGELRQNASRMAPLESLEALHQAIEKLRGRTEPLAVRLGPEERRRGVRYAHTFYPGAELEALKKHDLAEAAAHPEEPAAAAGPVAPPPAVPLAPDHAEALGRRIDEQAEKLAALEARLERLEKELGLGGTGG